jgi:hypothetical protein
MSGGSPDRKEKTRALTDFAFNPNLPSQGKNGVFHDRKAKPGSARLSAAVLIGSVKALKDPFLLLWRNANSCILDAKPDQITLSFAVNPNHPGAIGVFDGVIDQVVKNHFQKAGVRFKVLEWWRDIDVPSDLLSIQTPVESSSHVF